MNPHHLLSKAALVIGTVLFVIPAHTLAWTGPTSAPPGGNTSAPINISGTAQTKSGGFTAASFSGSGTGLTGTAAGLNIGGYATYINTDQFNMKLHWAGQGGQPSWLWGSNDGTNAYVWNPANFSVSNSNTVGGLGTGSFLKWNTWEHGNYYQTNGDIYMGWAGSWLSTVLSQKPNGHASTYVYQCPPIGAAGGSCGGGAWGFYGCNGQITTKSYCETVEYPNVCIYGCTPLGSLLVQ
jgi:hypothetical protein